jgi:hypothetical protein
VTRKLSVSLRFRAPLLLAQRYAYRGNLNFRFENLITSERLSRLLKQNTIYNGRILEIRKQTQIPVFSIRKSWKQ